MRILILIGVISCLAVNVGKCQSVQLVEVYSNVDNDYSENDETSGEGYGGEGYGGDPYVVTRLKQKVRVLVNNSAQHPVSFALYTTGASEKLRDYVNNLQPYGYEYLEYEIDEQSNPNLEAISSFRVERRYLEHVATLLSGSEDDYMGSIRISESKPPGWMVPEGWTIGGSVFTKYLQVSWGRVLEWPEEPGEKYELYTWPVAIPSTAPTMNETLPYGPQEATGFSQVNRASGSWGMRYVAVDFPIDRCMLLPSESDGEIDESPSVYYGDVYFSRTLDGVIDLDVGTSVTQAPQSE